VNIALSDDWQLWPDYAVRSSGFPVQGLEAFGPGEDARLAEVARDPAFREAVAWQSRESLTRAVDKLAGGVRDSPSRQRRWTDVVASYWQRYCAKNDTIGYFGPLAWGTFGERDSVRSGALERERVVHFETWAMEAVGAADARAGGPGAGAALGADIAVADRPGGAGATAGGAAANRLAGPCLPMCPFPERALRPLLRDSSGLDRLEATRAVVAAAPRTGVAAALDQLDRAFEEVTGRGAARADGDSGGGRTVAYLDCMRDLDLTLGPAVLEELHASLPPVLYASRWWCGKVFERGTALLGAIADGHEGPLAPLLGPLMGAGFGLWNQLESEQAELQRRWAAVTSGERGAADAFADWTPAWHGSGYHSADIQIAAADADAIARGDFLLVLGDFHGGDNPLAQGIFGLRHPDPAALLRRIRDEIGPGVHLSPPRRGVVEMTARSWPLYPEGDVIVAGGDEPAPAGTRRVALEDVILAGGQVTDRAGTFSAPLAEFLYLPIFVAGLRSFAPVVPRDGHRAQIGRLVVRRATWSVGANELGADLAGWARERGLPRRVFARSPLERKPRYVDFESPALCRALRRFAAPAGEQAVEFTEMLPGPGECWLESDAGGHTSELRLVALPAITR
jgi:hypothetical protein